MKKNPEKILYADDEKDIQGIVKIALEDIGNYQIKICDNGEEVLQGIKEFNPDLLLLDVMMPKMDGPTTLVRLRELHDAHIPIIFITAKARSDETARLIKLGCIGIISKPFDPLTLADKISEIWQAKFFP